MMNLNRFIRSSGFRLGLIVSILVMVMIVILNFVVLRSSQEVFIKTVQSIRVMDIVRRRGELPENFDILKFDVDGVKRLRPLEEDFREELQQSLLKVGLISVVASFVVGYLSSATYTNTLNKLRKGMKRLKEENYKLHLETTGDIEFDEVIAEFNTLSDKLQTAEELRRELISDTSHELKTPIAALIGQLEAVKDGVVKMDASRAELLLNQVYRLNDLIETLQEYSRLRSKTSRLVLTHVNVKELIEKVVQLFDSQLKEKNIKVRVDVDTSLELEMDAHKVTQVINNLLGNALCYSEATEVTISADKNKLIFKDNGKGVSPDQLDLLFERFYRVEKSRNRNLGGMGLGLSIVKEIVEAHGWKIVVENDSGLKFTLLFQ